MIRFRNILLAAALLAAGSAQAATPAQVYATQCGACHMAYPPTLLPARSWKVVIAGLQHHFGEDATLGRRDTATIATFLAENAADGPLGNSEFLRGLPPTMTPHRITDMPFWRVIHARLLEPGIGTGPGIRKAAACNRCHNVNGGGEGGEGGGESGG
ncbi:MAG: hypothetical protein KGK10_00230 [Rhodospirillales bacterium]|nr:hypothetical protein [Rhodospirillales bacterium]